MLCGLCSFVACSDDDATPIPTPDIRTYHYLYNVPNGDDTFTVVLDSVNSPIANIENPSSWVTVKQAGDQNGHPVIQIQTQSGQPNTENTVKVILTMADGNTVELTLCQGYSFVPDNNSAEEFISNWEKQDTVVIYTKGKYETIYTPWSSSYSSSTIPEDICRNIKKKDGWEMAFCALGDRMGNDLNYFGLYNRYLGILRVFYFTADASGTGSQYNFEVNMGKTSTSSKKYPFYNALAYSIPTSHKNINGNMDLSGSGQNITFKTWANPYSSMTSQALAIGWTAFDIDMSGYTPTGNDFYNSKENLQISCRSLVNQGITLSGEISADVSGKYSSATPSVSSSSGISSTIASLGSLLGDVQNSALAQIEHTLTGSPLDVGFYYAGVACNAASFAYDWIMDNGELNEQNIDSMPGKIELNLTGNLNLKGYIQGFASNNVASINITSSVFQQTNPNSSVGKGVWSLAEDPVMYVVDDHFLGSARRINLTVGDNHTYGTSEGASNEMRLVTFFDPRSVKLNINTELFPDISDIQVTTYYGVYPNAEKGHTSKFRSLLQLETPSYVNLVNHNSVKPGSIFRTTDSGNKMAYHQISKESLVSPSVDGDADDCRMVKQTGSDYSYYGRLLDAGQDDSRAFIIDPQVFFPVSEDGKTIYDAEIPDFVVSVFVSFKSGGRTFRFSRRYLPIVKLISGSDVNNKEAELTEYSNKCEKNAPINYLNGGNSLGVTHPNGKAQVEKTLKVLRAIIGK